MHSSQICLKATHFLAYLLAFILLDGCGRRATPAFDGGISSAPRDSGPDARRRSRRRSRRGPRLVASAENPNRPQNPTPVQNNAPDRGTSSPTPSRTNAPSNDDDFDPDDSPPPPRPRITETGPMLTDNLGPAPQQSIDFSSGGGDGPIGLDETAVSRGLNPLLGRFSNCVAATTDDNGRGPHGHISVRLRVRNDGQPTAARVGSGGAGSDFVNCARRVAASARFRPFRGNDVIVGWGFDVD